MAACLVASCGSGASTSASSLGEATTPGAFRDDLSAELASNGSRLWLAVNGHVKRHDRGPIVVKVFRQAADQAWHTLSQPDWSSDGSRPLSLAAAPSDTAHAFVGPCIGYSSPKGQPIVACRTNRGTWRRVLRAADVDDKAGGLLRIQLVRGRLVALFQHQGGAGSVASLYEFGPSGWRRRGESVHTEAALLGLGEGVSSPTTRFDLGIESQTTPPARTVQSFDGSDWAQSGPALKQPGLGPLLSGPVRTPAALFVPVVDADKSPWEFSVYSLTSGGTWQRVSGAPLSGGSGNAQGGIDYAAGSPWATWQENRLKNSGSFATKIFAREITPSGSGTGPKLELWHGDSIGPGDTQVVEVDGNLFALYMRANPSNRRGLQATVRSIEPG
jgi:hypothetical protein